MRTIETLNEAERPVTRRRRGSDGSSLRDRVVIIATVIGVIAFVLVGLPYLKHDLPPEGRRVEVTGDIKPDPDRDAVRAWLHANCRDPHPREIRWWPARTLDRSEEHTSELQSHVNLVCRLLLEKKKHLDNPSSRNYTSSFCTRRVR